MLRRNFSLIELLIVIGIMGALAALILPSFNNVESDAKDTACDYNQAGTLRYLNLFRSANGVYPTGFHTGYEMKGHPVLLQLAGANYTSGAQDPGKCALTTCGTHNFGKGSTSTLLSTLDEAQASLEGAGIVSLAYGRNIAERIDGDCNVAVVNDTETAGKYWTEELDPATGEVNGSGAPLEYHNAALYQIAAVGKEAGTTLSELKDTYGTALNCRKYTLNADNTNITWDESEFVIVPMYVAPTVDWEHYYKDGPNDSKISIAMAGKCPWGEGGQARYYIAFFKVYKDGTPATLLCTSCPDCGILDADMF